MDLALFDFDGTIIRGDSFIKFIRYIRGDYFFIKKIHFVLLVILLLKLKILTPKRAKELILEKFLNGVSRMDIIMKSKKFIEHLDSSMYKGVVEKLNWHKSQNHRIIVVTASCDIWVKPWAEKYNLELVSTKLEFIDDKFTCKIIGENCNGIFKVIMLKKYVKNLAEYTNIFAYGNSNGDKEMLNIANFRFYKYFSK